MAICHSCNTFNREGRRFCAECGAPLPLICAACGFENQIGEKFCGGCGHSLKTDQTTDKARAPALLPGAPAADGRTAAATSGIDSQPSPSQSVSGNPERRHLSVMFCDLVGSTELAGRLDPEDLRLVIRAYQRVASGAIHRFEGYVARFLGDGIMAYFGYPSSHENDAERALRAGLEVIAAVGRLNADPHKPEGVRYAVRVGVSTGLAVVGDLIGEGSAAEERAVVGEAPNLAARLQSVAVADQLVIGPTTETLVRGLFTLKDLGARELKGINHPVPVWAVERVNEGASRFEMRRAAGLTPLVGRSGELETLLGCWQKVLEGDGQAMAICAEAGIGKSRLVEALDAQVAGSGVLCLSFQCSPFYANTALYPLIRAIEKLASLRLDEADSARLAKLEAVLDPHSDDRETLPLVADLLSIPVAGRDALPAMSPEEKKAKTAAVLLHLVERLADRQPVLLIFEDLHWVDPTSLELIGQIIQRLGSLPVLLLATWRPEFEPPWLDPDRITCLHLGRLGREASVRLVANVAGGKPLPAEVEEQIVAKTDGVPLFIEELTKNVLESGFLIEQGDAYVLTGPLPSLTIPATLQESLLARLGRLAPIKEIAQIGAVIGREFSFRLIAAIAGISEQQVQYALEQLVHAEIVFSRGMPPASTYTFKHALLQDAAYESLLKTRRQTLHARTARVLERDFPETARLEPEVLAHHYTKAGLTEPAARYWGEAGKRALARSANLDVVAHVGKALDLLAELPESPQRDRGELELLILLGAAYRATKGFASVEAEETFVRARALCDRVGDGRMLMDTLRGLYACYYIRGELKRARVQAEQVVALGQKAQDKTALMVGHWMLGCVVFWQGECVLSRRELEAAVALYDPSEQSLRTLSAQIDPGLSALLHLIWTLWLLGYPTQSEAIADKAIASARSLAQPFALAMALHWACAGRICAGQFDVAAALLPELREITTRHNIAYLGSVATLDEGLILIDRGDIAQGLAKFNQAFAEFGTQGAGVGRPWAASLPVGALISIGETGKASAMLEEAFAMVAHNDEHQWESELFRLRGDVLLAQQVPDAVAAEREYRQAMDLANAQGARSLALRAATSLARLLVAQGDVREARVELKRVYDQFTEGFDTADLVAAKALLAELRDD
ncbi:MAG: AAA family ATPase [Thiohalocapsa sp.]